jgi:hypothetical protein
MLYTEVMSRSNKNARNRTSGPGRKVHFEEGRGAEHINAPGKDTYDYGNGTVINLSPQDKKRMATSDESFQWHSADPKAGVKAHHTYISYVNGCKSCEDLEEKRLHPNGSKPWE